MTPPTSSEYAPFYAGYVARVGDADVVAVLSRQSREDLAFLRALPAEKHDFAYAAGKWTVKELIGHMADAERIFAYRALRIGRGDATPLAGFEENDYTPASRMHRRSFDNVLNELETVRNASLSLIESFDGEALAQMGTASERPVSTKGLIYSIAGHWAHHLAKIKELYV